MMDLFNIAQAGTTGGNGAAAPPGGGLMMLVPFIFLFGVFYMLMIRPQKKKEKERREMVNALKKNDRIVTIGGIHGVVANVHDDDVTIKIDESANVRMKIVRSAVSRVVEKDDVKDEAV